MKTSKLGEEVTVKGFLFLSPNGEWILSPNPHLKSCCLGAKHLRDSQIVLSGDFSSFPTSTPFVAKGVLVEAHERYALIEAKIEPQAEFPYWTAGALLLCLGVILFRLKRLLLP